MSVLPRIVVHNVASMRAYPDSGAEQVSQAAMGELATPLEERGEYTRVRTADGYEGWMLTRHTRAATPKDRFWLDGEPADRISYVIAPFAELADLSARIVFGTRIERLPEDGIVHSGARVRLANGLTGQIGEEYLTPQGRTLTFTRSLVVDLARRFIGTPYLWGGTTSFGYDCSGFVQRLFGFCGLHLPRDAYQQAAGTAGAVLEPGTTFQAGDLLFFRGDHDVQNRGITHVGIAMDAERFIHAASADGVTITPIDDPIYQRIFRLAWRARVPER